MDLRPQSHEIIRTWLFSTMVRSRARVRDAAVVGRGDLRLDPRPGPEEDVQVQGERGHADRSARAVRLGRGAVLVGQRPVRRGHRVRPGAAEGRAAAGDQDPQRVEFVLSLDGPSPGAADGHRGGGPVHAGRARRRGAVGDRGAGWLRPRRGARGDRAVLLDVLRRLPRAGEGARVRRRARAGRPRRASARRRCARRCRCCCGCSRRSCRS